MKERLDHKELEERIAKFWEDEGIYSFRNDGPDKVYSIDTPPPTISGLIHLGHAFSYSQADFVARYKRMRGYNVFYPFGFDNNGIPTELFVEKTYGTTAEKEGREKFIGLVGGETAKFAEMYKSTWRSIGISVDWSLLYNTISEEVQKITQLSFIKLYRMGREYRMLLPTIWCPKEGTALSQMELKDKSLKSRFVTISFSDQIKIATTRPELLPACVAIFVNPDDTKNSVHVGKIVKVPIFGHEVKVIADRRVDMSKGTGMVMCCTFGDLTDIEWYKAYGLELKIVMDRHGKMLPEYFGGRKVREAREFVIEDLRKRGCIVDEKEIVHSVNVHERCGTEIEFLVKKQWFVKYLDMKQKLIELGRELEWNPKYMQVRYENWVNGLQWDWAISRQRLYGIPFPVWYCKKCDAPILALESDLPVNPMKDMPKSKCENCGSSEYVPEEDIFDTWATSSLTPLINARWGLDGKYMDSVYPMSLRPQAHDIISFWLFTTLVKCYLHTGKIPWKSVLISGHGLDSKGMPMHKSAGNIIEPKVVIEKYGADSLRHWASLSKLGDDASFQEKDVTSGARLVNKLWNTARFISMNDGKPEVKTRIIDRWIASRATAVMEKVTEMMEEYNYSGAKREADAFFWFFCDNYVEFIKYRLYGGDRSPIKTLREVFLIIIKMQAPFMPYITEEVYQELYMKQEGCKSIHISKWPGRGDMLVDPDALAAGDEAQKVIAYIRQWKHDRKIALNAEISEVVASKDFGELEADIRGAMNIRKLSKGHATSKVEGTDVSIEIMQ